MQDVSGKSEKVQLRTIAEIATIIGVVIALLAYMKIEPNALDKIPELYQEQAKADISKSKLKIKENEYQGENQKLFNMYKAALAVESDYSQDIALTKVIEAAIDSSDFKIAVLAGKEINSSYTKTNELSKIVNAALMNSENVGFAVIAAELIPSSYSKDIALSKIISYYEKGNTTEIDSAKELTALDKYKIIFNFADSTSSMDMSEEEAKVFTDNWMKERTYEDFLYFKKVFLFADSTSSMDMTEEEAKSFSLDWIANYSQEEFEIFKSAFTFADSSSGMGMSEKEAEVFARKKAKEHRDAANKRIQSDHQKAEPFDGG